VAQVLALIGEIGESLGFPDRISGGLLDDLFMSTDEPVAAGGRLILVHLAAVYNVGRLSPLPRIGTKGYLFSLLHRRGR
jgi:hypothetical protein